MRVVLILFALLAFSHVNAQPKDSASTEILMVNFYLPTSLQEVRGIYFFYPNDSLVFQSVDSWKKDYLKEKNYFTRNIQIKNKTFNDLYAQGWRLILYNPDDNTYYFERTIKN